jgi:tetratricopeptide (TPR) repeat protein
MKRIPTFALLLALVPAGMLLAGAEGRLKGFVKDKDGNPIVGANVALMAQEVGAARQAKTKKGGRFVMMVADATRNYMIRIEKEGYQTIQEPIKLTVGGQTEKEWVMQEGQMAEGASLVEVQAPGAKIYNEGAKAYNNGEIDTALAKFREAAAVNPELTEAWQGQAMIHWARENTAEALAAAEQAVALDPQNVLGLRVCFDAYTQLGDERAGEALDALVVADRTPGTARRVFNTGVSAVRANEAEEAIRRFGQAVEIDPTLAQGHQVLGQLYNLGKEHDKAIASAERLLELVPGSPEAHSILYEAYRATGEAEKAEVSWAILKEAKPEDLAKALYEEGQSLFNAGQIAEATAKLEQAIEAQPDHPAAYYTLGLCYLNSGDQTAAKESLERFLELSPDHPEAGSARDMLSFLQ